MKSWKKTTLLLFAFLAIGTINAQLPKWILGNSQANAGGTFYSLGINNLKFYELDFTGSLTSTQRTTGSSINNIMSVGTQDIMQSAVDTSGNILFYAFAATTVPFQSSGPANPDTVYFAAHSNATSADEVFGKVATEGWGASVIESELVRKPGSFSQYYFIYKTKAASVNLDNIRYVTVDAYAKTVSTPTSIVTNEKTGEGMAVSQIACANNQRFLFTSRPEASGDITIRKSTITAGGISAASDAYTISIPGNSIGVIAAIEIAPTNNMLAIANYSTAAVNKDVILLDFNSTTGALSNERYYTNQAANPIVTMEFSPDASRIYFLQGGSSAFPNVVYASPVSATNHTITSAEQLTGLTLSNSLTMEIAGDGKLYINPSQNANFLYVIANPNSTSPTVSSTITNLFGVNQRVGSGFPDQVDGDTVLTDPCVHTGIQEFSSINTKLVAYPNPTNKNFSVNLNKITGIVQVTIYDISGKKVSQQNTKAIDSRIDLTIDKMQPGVYFFNCLQEGVSIGNGKIIVN